MARRTHTTLLRDQRGTASIEAAVMLPLMAICWAALFFKLETLDGTLVAAASTREKAWTASNAACVGAEAEAIAASNAASTGASAGGDSFLDSLCEAPIIGSFFESIFGSSATIVERHEYSVPKLLGGGTTTAGYRYHVACNEQHRSFQQILAGVVCDQIGRTVGGAVAGMFTREGCPDSPPEGLGDGC